MLPLRLKKLQIPLQETYLKILKRKITSFSQCIIDVAVWCRETYQNIRQNIVEMVLATDMSKHFEHLSKFTTGVTSQVSNLSLIIFMSEFPPNVVIRRFYFSEHRKFG